MSRFSELLDKAMLLFYGRIWCECNRVTTRSQTDWRMPWGAMLPLMLLCAPDYDTDEAPLEFEWRVLSGAEPSVCAYMGANDPAASAPVWSRN
jgi:hypothetical protein